MQEYYLSSVVLLYLLVVFVNSPKVRIPEKVMFKAPDNLSPYDFFLHYNMFYYKMQPKHWPGNRSVYFLGQKTKKCGMWPRAIIVAYVFK